MLKVALSHPLRHPGPLRALAVVRIKHGLGEALNSAAAQKIINETYAPVTAAVAQLLMACEEDGSVRRELNPADVLLLMGFLWRVGSDASGRDQAMRVMDLTIRGLS